MGLRKEALVNGYSAAYEDRLEQAVLKGDLDGDEGSRLIETSLSVTDRRQQRAEVDQRQAAADARREDRSSGSGSRSTGKVKSAAQLKDMSKGFILNFQSAIEQINGLRIARGLPRATASAGDLEEFQGVLYGVALAHLSLNPGDYQGAYAMMKKRFDNQVESLKSPNLKLRNAGE